MTFCIIYHKINHSVAKFQTAAHIYIVHTSIDHMKSIDGCQIQHTEEAKFKV